jgi:transaldolase
VTGLTFNPTIFDQAIKNGDFYDDAIRSAVHFLREKSNFTTGPF